MPHNLTSIISLGLVVLGACAGADAQPRRGACEFRNAATEPFHDVAPQLEVCLPSLDEALCTTGELRPRFDSLPITRPVFTAGATCDALGYEPCDQTRMFPYCRGGEPVAPPPPTFAVAPSQPGPAYVAVRDHIAVILPDGTAQVVADATGYVHELALGADGEVYALTMPGSRMVVWKLAGATATKLGTLPAYSTNALAVGKDGTVYVAQNFDVYSLAPGAKKATKLPQVDDEFVEGLSFDAEGRLVAATEAIAVWNGTAWDVKQIPGQDGLSDAFTIGSGESLVVGAKGLGLFTMRGGELVPLVEKQPEADRATTSPNGAVIAYLELGDVHLRDRKGGTVESEIEPHSSSALVIDDAARLWHIEDGGLVVRSLLSSEATAYPIGTLPALTGLGSWSPDGAIVVVGAGPARLPAVGAVQVVDQVIGRLLVQGEPVVNETIEICTSAASLYQGSPCAADASRLTATTNDAGEFAFAAVPVGRYDLAVSWGTKWVVSDTHIDLDAPAPLHSIGTLRYGAPE